MNYTITPSADGSFILIKVRGDINRHSAMQMNLEAHELGRQLQLRRYLVDVTESRNTDDTLDIYEFAHLDMRRTEGIDLGARVAMLVSPGDHSHDFVETTLYNAGLNGRLFTDPDKARQFLLDGKIPGEVDTDGG
jgi:hypothetical protein